MKESERRQALGNWGEEKTLALLKNAQFNGVRDVNAETHNHPFGDIYAERGRARFVIGSQNTQHVSEERPFKCQLQRSKKGLRYLGSWQAIQC